MSYIPEPITRIDKYLAYIAGNMDVALPDHPITRKEHYLAAWAEKSGFEDVDVAGEPPLTLENAIGKPLKGLKIYGRSVQKTTTGAQLLEKNIVVHPPNGKVSTIVLFEGELSGTYTVSCELEGDAKYPTRAALEIIVDGVEKFCTINNHTVVTGTITKIECFAQNTYCDFTGTLNIMLNAGSTPLPWEPYTGGQPSPSPDYPQEIESVGMKWSTGANLLDISQWNTYEKTYGLTCKIENDTVTIKGVYERPNYEIGTRIQAMYRFLRYKPGTTFPDGAKVAAQIIKSDGTEGMYVGSGLKENTPCIVIAFYAVTGQEVEIQLKPMIYVGDTAPEWEPYTGGVPKPYGDKIGVTVGNGVDESQSMSISTPNGLPGIPVSSGGNYTDADGQQWICDEIDLARGVYVQRVWNGEFDGSDDERWEIYNNANYAGFYLNNVFAERIAMRNGIANTYKVDNSFIPIEAVWIGMGERAIYIKNSRFYDDTLPDKGLSNFKAGLAAYPMVVMTYLDNPIETSLTSDQLAAYKQLHTYKGTTIIDNDAGAYMSVKYEKMK